MPHALSLPTDLHCKRCGDDRPPTTRCSLCGGHGIVTGYMGDPEDCPDCGCSGMVWPPRCPQCYAFRKWAAVKGRGQVTDAEHLARSVLAANSPAGFALWKPWALDLADGVIALEARVASLETALRGMLDGQLLSMPGVNPDGTVSTSSMAETLARAALAAPTKEKHE